MSAQDWRPGASLDTLRLRATLLARVRDYFAAHDVLEVETPVLASAPVSDVHLASLSTNVAGHGRFYLQTSPEFAMKRLLAAGAPDLYQIARVFRDAEVGAQHNPEFTLIEWYRRGFDLNALMDDCEQLLASLLHGKRTLGPSERTTYANAVERHAGIDVFAATPSQLRACVVSHGVAPPSLSTADDTDRDAWLDLIMSTIVGPKLVAPPDTDSRLTFIHDYPASQAALARLNPADPRVARRFEIYLDGMELANGFHELAEAREQRRRFERDLEERARLGLPAVALDERLLAALQSGLPECSGVALGFDRVVMIAAGARRIEEVLAFGLASA